MLVIFSGDGITEIEVGEETRTGYSEDMTRMSLSAAIMPGTPVDSIWIGRLAPHAYLEGEVQQSLAMEGIRDSHLATMISKNANLFETLDARRKLAVYGIDVDSVKSSLATVAAHLQPGKLPHYVRPMTAEDWSANGYVLTYESRFTTDPSAYVPLFLSAVVGTCTAFVVPLVTWGHLHLEVQLYAQGRTLVWEKQYRDSFRRMLWLPYLPLGKTHITRQVREHYQDVWRLALSDLAASGATGKAMGNGDRNP
jgi:hypothetical protein